MEIADLRLKIELVRKVLPVRPALQPKGSGELEFYIALNEAAYPEFIRPDSEDKTEMGRLEQQWLRARKDDSLPWPLVGALCRMFAGLTTEMLESPFDDFEQSLKPLSEAFSRFERAADKYASSRSELAAAIRPYYLGVEANPNFPLLYLDGWLPSKPVFFPSDRIDDDGQPLAEAFIAWKEGDALLAKRPHLEPLKFEFHELKKRLNPKLTLFDAAAYRLLKIDVTRRSCPQLTFGLGGYFDYFDSCEVLGLELSNWYSSGSKPTPTPADLPLRGNPSLAFDLEGRSAVPGINTLFVVLNYRPRGAPRKHVFFYHDRRESVGEAQNTFHVVPAGTFQPYSKDDVFHNRDFSLRRNVLRELAEELLGRSEVQGMNNKGEDFANDPLIRPFRKAIENGTAKLAFLGLGLDPITTKPEILTCLVVDWDKLLQATQSIDFKENYEGEFRIGQFSKPKLMEFSNRTRMLPAGAACMRLVADHYEDIMKSCIKG